MINRGINSSVRRQTVPAIWDGAFENPAGTIPPDAAKPQPRGPHQIGCGEQITHRPPRSASAHTDWPPWLQDAGRELGWNMVAWVQYSVLGATALLAVALTVAQTRLDRSVFSRYFGAFSPVAVMILISALAFISLTYLRGHGSFEIVGSAGLLEGLRLAALVAPLFAVAAIGADLLLRYPEDMNVPTPDALLFYPAIGFVVEVCLHAVPIALLVAVFSRSGPLPDRTFWVMAVAVAMLEAGVQSVMATTTPTAVFSGLQLLGFGLVQMYFFRRFGFVSMFALRLAYYCLWHVLWGAVRLRWLF